jgi:hypothetical protein
MTATDPSWPPFVDSSLASDLAPRAMARKALLVQRGLIRGSPSIDPAVPCEFVHSVRDQRVDAR